MTRKATDPRREQGTENFVKQYIFLTVFEILILTPGDKCSSHSSTIKLLFARDGDSYRDEQVVKIQRPTNNVVFNPTSYNYNGTHIRIREHHR